MKILTRLLFATCLWAVPAGAQGTDAFGRLRVSQPVVLFNSVYDFSAEGAGTELEALRWISGITAGGTLTPNAARASMTLAVTNAQGDQVIHQSKERFTYRAGQSIMVNLTSVMGAAEAGVRKRVGLFDDDDGMFLEQTVAGALQWCVRSSVSGGVVDDCQTPRESVPGAPALDVSQSQILWWDFQYLGVGRVRSGYYRSGERKTSGRFYHAGKVASVCMRRGTLPVRFEITNVDGSAGAASLEQICSSVVREGAASEPGASWGASRNNDELSLATDDCRVVIALRSKSVAANILVLGAELLGTTANGRGFSYYLLLNPDITAGALVWADLRTGQSIAQVAIPTDAAQVVADQDTGVIIAAGYVGDNKGTQKKILITEPAPLTSLTLAGASDELVVCAKGIGGTPKAVGALSWSERY